MGKFWLLDLNEGVWEGRPCVKLWGIDEGDERVMVISSQISPYFYILPSDDLESFRQHLEAQRQRFPHISAISIESRKLLGKERAVLRLTCSQPEYVLTYAKQLPKALGGASYDDLRFSSRYIVDLYVVTCGWNECEITPARGEASTSAKAYVAESLRAAGTGFSVQPKLRMLSFAILMVGLKGSARVQRDPIQALAVATDSGPSLLLVASGEDDSALLQSFVETVKRFDPDVIVGYESNRTQWSYLLGRMKVSGTKAELGRDRSEPHTSMYGHVSVTGRANLDLADLANGIVEIKVKDLKNLCLHFKEPAADALLELDEWELAERWADTEMRRRLLEDTRLRAEACLRVAKETIAYPCQLSAITGLPLDQVLAAAVGFRVDFLFVRTASRFGELIPSRNEQPFLTYRGALVLEPKIGVHENIAVLDFASMYPSLMKKYNLSPDTLVAPGEVVPAESVYTIPEVGHHFRREPDGFYRVALNRLIDERAQIKRQLDSTPPNSAEAKVLSERGRAIKVVTNACYGYAGWAGARWYVREIAESAAALGRQLITETIDKAKGLGLEVIYSDTDSLFVSNDEAKVKKLVNWINEDPDLEIKVDQEYVRVLFTEAMKRYAGLKKDGELDVVGLEVVRGDWSEIAHRTQEQVLLAILRDRSTELAIRQVRAIVQAMRGGEIPLEDYLIRKALTKPIEKYRVRTPHVEVARKLAEEGWNITVGDKVAYVIVKGKGSLFQKARPPSRAKLEDLDLEYYVANQVKPAAMRILETFGISEAQLDLDGWWAGNLRQSHDLN